MISDQLGIKAGKWQTNNDDQANYSQAVIIRIVSLIIIQSHGVLATLEFFKH